MGFCELRQTLMMEQSPGGQVLGSPREFADQSKARIRAPIVPPDARMMSIASAPLRMTAPSD
jgi:hypothetical protein